MPSRQALFLIAAALLMGASVALSVASAEPEPRRGPFRFAAYGELLAGLMLAGLGLSRL